MTERTGGKRVLVVDDDRALLDLIDRWLTDAGHSVITCDRFEAARQQLTHSPPDVLLTDVRLGPFNGLQLVIQAKEQRPETIAIVMSAYDDPMLRNDTAESGARYLQKPFESDAVIESLTGGPSVAKSLES